MSKWIVDIYEEENGEGTLAQYFGQIPAKDRASLLRVIGLLEANGPEIHNTRMDKLIEGSLRELRKNRHRIIYGRDGNHFILFVAFLKKTKKTPEKYIDLAKVRFAQYKARKMSVLYGGDTNEKL
jgi:phage-related protein